MATNNLPTTATHKFTGSDYAEVFEAEFDPNTKRLAQGGGVSDRMRNDRVMELHVTMHKTSWERATIINMHPFELRHGMGNIGEARVPKKKDGEPYTKYVIDKYRISMRDLGDAKFIPEPVLPVQIAEDVALAFKDFGGVFWYRGVGDPDPEAMQVAYESQLEFYTREYEKGLDFWHRTKQIKLITDHMRNAAKELYRIGRIAQLPEWMTVTRSEADRKMCDNCGNDIKKSAKTCSYCNFVIDVAWYEANKSRFTQAAGSIKPLPAPVDPIDESNKVMEEFMSIPDPEASNQTKNLDELLASKLPEDLRTKLVTKSEVKLNKGK